MQIGRVKSELWLERASAAWNGLRLVCVSIERCDGTAGAEVVAADTIGTSIGDRVILGSSSKVRDKVVGLDAPVITVVLAIVDSEERPDPPKNRLQIETSLHRCKENM